MAGEAKIYCGVGYTREFDNGGHIHQILFHQNDLDVISQAMRDGKVRVDLCERREPSENGATHYCVINTYKPPARDDTGRGESTPAQEAAGVGDDDNLPF